MYTWADLMLPPINLLTYPLQRRDYEMSDIEETGIGSHYETHIKPIWKPKVQQENIEFGYKIPNANDMQVDGDHYKKMGIQPWELMESLLEPEEFIGFLKGNVMKYALRDGKKEGATKDAEKARHYMAKLAEMEEYR